MESLYASDEAEFLALFDRTDDCITLCEIKYSEKPYAIDKRYANILKTKADVFNEQTRNQKQLFLVMIAAAGLKKTIYSEEFITDCVTLDDLFD